MNNIYKEIDNALTVEALTAVYQDHKPVFLGLSQRQSDLKSQINDLDAELREVNQSLEDYPKADDMLNAFYLRLGELTKNILG